MLAKFPRVSLLVLLLLVTRVLADDEDTDFLMNVFSDLGPVLALFGEQFARQFLSETFTWYDHLIFACFPLGIMTAIAGAIRVEGCSVLKAFIGRARENKSAAEIEYMSSTSAEVGELFNGKGIVRTMGQSKIAQFIVFPKDFNSGRIEFRETLGIHTLYSATEEGKEVIRREDYRDNLAAKELEDGSRSKMSSQDYWESLRYPNLQLNIAAKRITAEQRSLELHLAAIVAIILQVSLLVLAAVIPYQVSGFEKQPWGLPCYMGGSVSLFVGMLACSVAIERSTKEYRWISNDLKTGKDKHMSLFWVQGKQRVSDQEFGSYILFAQDKEFILTSSQNKERDETQFYKRAFPVAFKKMWLFYKLQGRAEFFLELKESCRKRTKEATWLLEPMSQDMKVFMEQIRFTKLHQQTSNDKQIDLGELQEKKLETRDVFGWTALHYAAACDDLQVIGCSSAGQAALSDEKRPKDWWFDNFGRSPIHIACLSGNLKFLKILLANSSDQDVRSALQYRGLDGMTPVHLAVVGGHKKCLRAFFKLSYFYELDFKEDARKRSPVHLAIAQGKYSCCTALLENGELEFKPSTLDTLGKSALSYLDEKNDEQRKLGHLLLNKYSKKFQDKDNEGQTVWHHAVRFLSDDYIGLLRDKLLTTLQEKHERSIDSVNRAQESPLHLAVHRKNDELVGRLLSMGAHLSTNKDKSQSPLILACSLGRLKMVKTMLESKSRAAEDQDGKGKLALHYVAESRECNDEVRPEIMNRLVEAMRNADMKSIDFKDNHGRTPLHIATENANISAVSTLISSGADPNTKDKDGANALHYALASWRGGQRSAEGMQKITQSLLTKAPACIDATDNMGSTPLTLACRMGKPLGFIHQVVELSKQKGSKINLNQPDGLFGQSPLTWACEMEEKAIVMTLLESAAVDLSQRSTGYMGYTPLHFALKKKNQQIVQMLVCNPKRHADIDVPSSESPDLIEFACRESDRHCIETLLLHPEAKSSKFLTSAWKRAVQQPSRIADMTWFVHEWEVAILEPQNNVPFPLHELAEVGRLETFHSLLQDEKLHHQFDDNGWTPADVASRYRHNDLAEFLRKNEPPRDVKVDPYAEPSTFVNLFRGPELETSTCHSHDQCFHENLESVLWDSARKTFSRTDSLGGMRVPLHHGDDGGFYVSNASGDPQENDEIFDKDDVVGCGLNLKTGHGYRSKNGVLLGSSHRFQETQFSTGRFYPWIAAKTNGEGDQFKVQVTLRSSEEHPFQYKGSYNGGLLRNE
ncbi:unnamed protein product [Fusarium graminearum]|uniref:Protein SSH4 n=1 Tax=Gibberella zeae TaxID=5518 RepID=A0A9N8RR01_GIBZA|nr:unnamed protein product [Fusarium graminearum]